MTLPIQKIEAVIPFTDKRVTIDLQGRNLIITGGNGCGKTQFITAIFNQLQNYSTGHKALNCDELRRQIGVYETEIKKEEGRGAGNLSQTDLYKSEIDRLGKQKKQEENLEMFMDSPDEFKEGFQQTRRVLRLFQAARMSNITSPSAIQSLDSLKTVNRQKLASDDSSKFENYLVSLKMYQSFEHTYEDNSGEVGKVNEWFEKLDRDLKYLFEDESLFLKFDHKALKFFIRQDNKQPFSLQSLSSGYSSILNVYADLLMKVEITEIAPNEISGVVIIDEIDAHLHVSLQRKIFKFLTTSFPQIQFIVTTHSPFVVTSVDDAVIYDLSNNEQLEDLSAFSYEAILKGLMGVKSTSDIMEDDLKLLTELLGESTINTELLTELLESLEPYFEKMDSRSKSYYLMAENALLDNEQE